MKRLFIGYGRQSIDGSDIDAVVHALKGGNLIQGSAVVVSRGTATLHISCLAAALGNVGVDSLNLTAVPR